MFRKSFALLVVSFILVACGEKVTEDMIVGRWDCKLIVDQKNDLNTKSLELKDVPIYNAHEERVYEKENDAIVLSFDGYKTKPFKFQASIIGEYKEAVFEPGYEVKTSTEYVFISTNEFKIITDHSIRDSETKREIIKGHEEDVCQRIID